VYEAVGVSSLAFDVMRFLGVNGAFILTGVPGHKAPIGVDTDALMRDQVLKNQVVFGTVNASVRDFQNAIADIGAFHERWPKALASIISHRVPLQEAIAPLSGKVGGIKNIIAVA
jgi:threonine dehydrogenase-like Zn-dependent dehydrogenase